MASVGKMVVARWFDGILPGTPCGAAKPHPEQCDRTSRPASAGMANGGLLWILLNNHNPSWVFLSLNALYTPYTLSFPSSYVHHLTADPSLRRRSANLQLVPDGEQLQLSASGARRQ